MKTNWLTKRLVLSMLALSLLVGIGMTSSATVQAQWPNDSWQRQRDYEREQRRRQREWQREQRRRQRDGDWRNDDWRYGGGSYELRQTALNAGYNEGIKEGRRDRDRGERFEYRDEEDFRNANTDYNSRFGNRSLYQQYFRQGFANGYRDGYGGY